MAICGIRDAGLMVDLLGTRLVRDAFKAMPVKTDRNDARHRPADAAWPWQARSTSISDRADLWGAVSPPLMLAACVCGYTQYRGEYSLEPGGPLARNKAERD